MFCSHCGSQAAGNFCAHCGSKLASASRELPEASAAPWQESLDYEVVSQEPTVKHAIARANAAAAKPLSAERLMEVMDAALAPITLVPTSVIAKIAMPLSERIGLKTGKRRSEQFSVPPGQALAAVLCALAEHSCELTNVAQETDACRLVAKTPSDWRSFAARLEISVIRTQSGSQVDAEAVINGQWYDWGRCREHLDVLFSTVKKAA
ncbi:MAG: hypothetical protein KDA61_19395 [Planctomycetales bacterium]|nr:hypothetical protein [Planctomycetales bacterium]